MKTLTDAKDFRKIDNVPLFDFKRIATKAAKDAEENKSNRYTLYVVKSPNVKDDKYFLSLTAVKDGKTFVYYSNNVSHKTTAQTVQYLTDKGVKVHD